jgi:hypothetical protein
VLDNQWRSYSVSQFDLFVVTLATAARSSAAFGSGYK